MIKKRFFAVAFLLIILFGSSVADRTYEFIGVTARLQEMIIIRRFQNVNFGGIYVPLSGMTTVVLDHANDVTLKPGTTPTTYFNEHRRLTGIIAIFAKQDYQVIVTHDPSMYLANAGGKQIEYRPQLFSNDGTPMPSGSQFTLAYYGDLPLNNYNKVVKVGGELDIPAGTNRGRFHGILPIAFTWQ